MTTPTIPSRRQAPRSMDQWDAIICDYVVGDDEMDPAPSSAQQIADVARTVVERIAPTVPNDTVPPGLRQAHMRACQPR